MTEVSVEADEPEISTTLPRPRAYEPPEYRRVKKLQVIMINKGVRKSLAHKKGNKNPIWSWKESAVKTLKGILSNQRGFQDNDTK